MWCRWSGNVGRIRCFGTCRILQLNVERREPAGGIFGVRSWWRPAYRRNAIASGIGVSMPCNPGDEKGRDQAACAVPLDMVRKLLSIGPCEANGANVGRFWACNSGSSGVNSISTTAQSLSGGPDDRISFPPISASPRLRRWLRAEPAPNPPDGTAHNGVLVSRIQQIRRCADMLDVKRRFP